MKTKKSSEFFLCTIVPKKWFDFFFYENLYLASLYFKDICGKHHTSRQQFLATAAEKRGDATSLFINLTAAIC